METPDFLSLTEILEIHANQIELYGGSPGIRDMGLLEAAIAQAKASFGAEFLHKDIFEIDQPLHIYITLFRIIHSSMAIRESALRPQLCF